MAQWIKSTRNVLRNAAGMQRQKNRDDVIASWAQVAINIHLPR